MFLRNLKFSPNYTASRPSRPYASVAECIKKVFAIPILISEGGALTYLVAICLTLAVMMGEGREDLVKTSEAALLLYRSVVSPRMGGNISNFLTNVDLHTLGS
jgi:hypothetical protein